MKIKTIFLVVAMAVVFAFLGCESGKVSSVVLITVDGLSVKDAEAIKAVAENAAIFDYAISPSPSSLPAMASLFTGMSPLSHGLVANDNWKLDETAVTLGEAFQENKWRSAAFVGATNVGAGTGIDQGFDIFTFNFTSMPVGPFGNPTYESAASVTEDAAKWMKLFGDKPFFMWAHYGDLLDDWAGPLSADERNKKLQNIATAVDALIKSLPKKGAESIVILTAPASNADGAHGETGHGTFVYNSTARVPFMFMGPSIKKGRIAAPVSLEDIFPTILSLLNFPAAKNVKGADLTPMLRGAKYSGPDRERVIVSMEPFYRWGYSPLTALVKGKYKLIVDSDSQLELYDLSADAQEANNIAASNASVVQEMKTRLAELEKTLKNNKPPAKYAMAEIKPEGALPTSTEKIKSLQLFQKAVALYKQKDEKGAYQIFAEAAASDPINRQIATALALTSQSSLPKEAQVALWETASKLNPGDPMVLVSLAEAENNVGDSEGALKLLESALNTNAYNPTAHMFAADILLGNAAKLKGQAKREVLEKALRHLFTVIRTDDSNPIVYYKAGLALTDMANVSETLPPVTGNDGKTIDKSQEITSIRNAAKRTFEQAISADPKSPDPYLALGKLGIKMGDKATAKKRLEEYLKIAPEGPGAEEAKKLIQTL